MNEYSEIHDLQKRLSDVKEELLHAIINEESIPRIGRLLLIEQNGLFKTAGYIQTPLKEKYAEPLKELVKAKGRKYVIEDNWPVLDPSYLNKGERISLLDQLVYTAESLEADEYPDGIPVIRDRSTKEEIRIGYEELVDEVYDWCVKNKTIAFHFDW
jgi:hypothetical protein